MTEDSDAVKAHFVRFSSKKLIAQSVTVEVLAVIRREAVIRRDAARLGPYEVVYAR